MSSYDDFIYQFIKFGETKLPNPEFDSYIQTLAKQSKYNQLVDILLRLLYKAGYRRFVIFIDEMERISTYETKERNAIVSERAAEILNLFHRLHTEIAGRMNQSTQNGVYPSVAQLMAMPDNLFEDFIRKVDPALYDKWDLNEIALDVIPETSPTADELIKKIWELHREAGYILKAFPPSLNVIKDSLYKELNKVGEAKPATMRHLIPKLIKIIQEDWVRAI